MVNDRGKYRQSLPHPLPPVFYVYMTLLEQQSSARLGARQPRLHTR